MKAGDYVCKKLDAKYGDFELFQIKTIEEGAAVIYWLPTRFKMTDKVKLSDLITIPKALELILDYNKELKTIIEASIDQAYAEILEYKADPEKFIKDHIPQEE